MLQLKKIYLKFTSVGADDIFIEKLKKILAGHDGETKVYMKISSKSNDEVLVATPYKVKISDKLFEEIKEIIGEKSWEIVS